MTNEEHEQQRVLEKTCTHPDVKLEPGDGNYMLCGHHYEQQETGWCLCIVGCCSCKWSAQDRGQK